MNQAQKTVQQAQVNDESHTIKQLQRIYGQARKDCESKIRELSSRTDLENIQTIIYQKQYQEALKKQLDGIIDNLNSNQFTTVADYLQQSYYNGYTGVMYDMHKQGIPVVAPINQNQVVKAVKTDSKISKGLYTRLGEDTDYLKKSIRAELSRGVANGSTWNEIAGHIANGMNSPFDRAINNAIRISRTEGHRIQQQSAFDAQKAAKDKGADVVKQWCSTLDDLTRETHQKLDGQIREIDEDFEVDGMTAPYPGGFNDPAEDCNCRCCILQRAKWALDQDELDTLKDRADYFGLDKSDSFEEFRDKYLHLPDNADTMDVDNGLFPAELAGVQRGERMTFENADTYHVNPNYGKENGYSINCQSCVVTFEARQRGYDVQVLPNTKGSMLEKLSYHTNLAWIDPATGKNPKYIFDDSKTYTAKSYLKYLDGIIEQDNRYTIEFSWKGRSRCGHIVNLDRTESGLLRIKDNQRGQGEQSEWVGNKEVLQYLGRMKYSTSVYGTKFNTPPKVLRIDNMEFDTNVVNQIMKGSGSK